MNIFVLDLDPVKAAAAHCDKHVVKMCVEYAQLLSTSARLLGFEHEGYANTHVSHPCTQWAAHPLHWAWLYRLAVALGAEYSKRYGKVHKSTQVLELMPQALRLSATHYFKRPPKTWAIVVPDDCLVPGKPVDSYRRCYLQHKASFAVWRHGPAPAWWP